jgi:hypothetical protein
MFELPKGEGPVDFDDIVNDHIVNDHNGDANNEGLLGEFDEGATGPSLPIILLSAASALAGGIVTLYITYRLVGLEIELSAGLATFAASLVLGITGAGLSIITGSRAAMSNIAFSCGLIVISALFLGICTLLGALMALLLAMVGR